MQKSSNSSLGVRGGGSPKNYKRRSCPELSGVVRPEPPRAFKMPPMSQELTACANFSSLPTSASGQLLKEV